MKKFFLVGVILFSIIYFYSQEEKLERKIVIQMLNSKNTDSVLMACHYIIKKKDSTFNSYLIKNPYQYKISMNFKFYGFNGYMSRMKALAKLTGINPPREITRNVDSVIIDFYRKRVILGDTLR